MKLFSKNLLLFTLIGMVNWAQAADLLETFRSAQANDPVFASARAALQAGIEKGPQGRSALLPTILLGADSTFNSQDIHFQNPTYESLQGGNFSYNSHGYGVRLTQPLFRQQNWLAYTSSQIQVLLAESQFRIAEQDLVMRVAQAYFDVLIAQDSVQLAEAQRNAISEQLEQAKRNFEVGSATITDTLEAQARYDLTLAQQIAVKNDLEIKQRSLQQLINESPQDLNHLGKNFVLEAPQPPDMEQWVAEAESKSPQLVAARANAELADKEVVRSRGGHYPTVDLVANFGKTHSNGGSIGGTDATNKSLAVQLNIPLFQGGLVNSRWREAEANRERSKQEMENARRSVTTQTRQAYLGVVSGIARVEALQQAMSSSENVLEASKLGQEVGVRTNLDVLNAQQQLYATRKDLFQSQYSYLMSLLNLKAAVGTLTEEELGRINQALH